MNPIRDLRKLANELEAISKISVEIAKVDSRTVAISGLPADVIALAEKALVEGEDSDSGLAMERRLDEIAGQLEVQGADCGHCEPKNAARDLAQQREVLQQAPKENLINLLLQEGLSLEAAEQFGYAGGREPAADWMRENVEEAKIQGLFYNWSPGTPEEGEVMLQAVGI